MRISIQVLSIFIVGLLSSSLSYCQAEKKTWPVVAKLQKSIYFEDASKAEAKITIAGIEGQPLYLIKCHTWLYESDPDFDYSGDFECRLTSLYSPNYYSTLFTDNPKQSRDWESRGRFLAEELYGKCGDYPEYGRKRQFRLRGMKITLAISDLKVRTIDNVVTRQRPRIETFRFDILVESDPTAPSEITAPVPYAEPLRAHPENPDDASRNCETVKLKIKENR
ncbi:MAG: hypothetical protein C4526_06590 [Nitrospiraceae bacterium]|nr:MAG: hypothetical protein C4526_06590 [Nitrospiraceae bacterium]